MIAKYRFANLASVPAYPLEANSGYLPSLDGLRAIAIGLVVIAHIGLGYIVPGGFGVTVFFFISGFLITRLLFAEYKKNGRISISSFYKRRILRLAPALMTVIIAESLIYYAENGFVVWAEILSAVFYSYNYYKLFFGHQMEPLGSLWSLAVEEHYYFVFPFIFSRNVQEVSRFVRYVFLACSIVLLWRLILVYNLEILKTLPYYPYSATDCRIDSILFGALLALAIEDGPTCAKIIRPLMTWPWFVTGFAMLLAALVIRNEEFRETTRYTIQGLALIPIFACSLFGNQFGIVRACLEIKPLVWMGKISYSLYLWHFPVQYLFLDFFPDSSLGVKMLTCLPAMLIVSSMSYYFVEQPFVGLRRRLHANSKIASLSPAPGSRLSN
jgi:peptidoglycan/LPS O-acetylase OafA/YrhL